MTIVEKKHLADKIFEFTLTGELITSLKAGQFIHIRVHNGIEPLLRRPISIAKIDREKKQCAIVFRAEGKGTTLLAQKEAGDLLDVLGPMGNGFPIPNNRINDHFLLIGGGIGVPPLFETGKQLVNNGIKVTFILGFQSEKDAFFLEECSELGDVFCATVDGSSRNKRVCYGCSPTRDNKSLRILCLWTCADVKST